MNESFGDARLEELELLSEIDRHGELPLTPAEGPFRDLAVYLVQERMVHYLNPTLGAIEYRQTNALPGETDLERVLHANHLEILFRILKGDTTKLRLTHRGRVRLSELKQALRTGREREPFGILWDVRHWEQDVQIAVLEARETSPFALVYLDMNGLKQINDRHGHDAGDQALRSYFQAVASVLGDHGQAYRLSGGADEVVVALPNRDEKAAVQIIRLACTKLMNERLWPMDPNGLLSIAAGIVLTTDPAESPAKLRAAADEEQKRAKQRSRESDPRPSVIAIRGQDLIVIEHVSGGFPVRIAGSFFVTARERGMKFSVTNTGKDPMPPFKICLFHPNLGSYFVFPPEKSEQLFRDQKSEHVCRMIKDGRLVEAFPKFTHDLNGEPLSEDDDSEFEFQLVLDDSDHKVLFTDKRLGRALMARLRAVAKDASQFGTWEDWNELRYPAPSQ